MLSSTLRKFTFTKLSSQSSAIPRLIYGSSCFLGVVSSGVFNRGGQVCLASVGNMKAGIRFFPFVFLFSPFHCMLLFYVLFFIFILLLHVFLLSFAHISYFLFHARRSFSLALIQQFFFGFDSKSFFGFASTSCFGFASPGFIGFACYMKFFPLSFASLKNYVT